MDGFYRMPVLQVRDPRALSDQSDIKALKNFFDSSPPLDADPFSLDVSPTSLVKSPDLRKQSRKRFFNLGKKRMSSGDLDSEPYLYGLNKSSSQSIPTGTTQRNLTGGHTVLMIGSPVPPLKMPIRTPTLEITPSSPIPAPPSPIHVIQPQFVSFSNSVPPRLTPTHNRPPLPPTSNYSVRPLLLKEKPEVAKKSLPQPSPLNSLSESEYRPHVLQSLQTESRPKSLPKAPTPHDLLESDSSLKMPFPVPLIPLKMATPGLGMTDAEQEQPTLNGAKRSASLVSWDSQTDTVQEQAFPRVRVPKAEPPQSTLAERIPQSPQQKAANRRAIYKSRSDLSSPGTSVTVPPGLGLPLTSPPSATSMHALPDQTSATSLQSAGSSKKRTRKNQATSAPHSTPMPNLDHVPLEIVGLEAMDDKPEAFLRLAGMYKQQKFLREAEEDFHRQKIADLTAGLMTQKIENLKLVQLLQQKGISMPEIQSVVGIALDATPLARDASSDTLASEEGPHLDASRFAMLKKEGRFGLMRQFSQGSITTLEADASRQSGLPNDANSAFDLIQRVKTSGSGNILTPAPSMPLPPVPHARRDIHSMVASSSTPATAPTTRSRSLTEGHISSVPYLDSFIIEHNMRRLERECKKSIKKRESSSTDSATSTPEILEILFGFKELNGNDETSAAETLSTGQLSLVIEDVGDGVIIDTTMDSAPTTEDMSNSGLCISSGLISSVSTFQTAESSNDADVSTFSSTNASPDPNPKSSGLVEDEEIALLRGQSIGTFDDLRTRHTLYTNVPSIETSTATPSPRPASVDDVTWGALFMGLMRRADSRARASSDGDLERGESISIKSVEV